MTEEIIRNLPEDGNWKSAGELWKNGQNRYGLGKIMTVACDEKWPDAEGNPLVEQFRHKSTTAYYMQDTLASFEVLHKRLMVLAIFAPDYFGSEIDLRKGVTVLTSYIPQKHPDFKGTCPAEEDWDTTRDTWIEKAAKAYPELPVAHALGKYIQKEQGLSFPETTLKTLLDQKILVTKAGQETAFSERWYKSASDLFPDSKDDQEILSNMMMRAFELGITYRVDIYDGEYASEPDYPYNKDYPLVFRRKSDVNKYYIEDCPASYDKLGLFIRGQVHGRLPYQMFYDRYEKKFMGQGPVDPKKLTGQGEQLVDSFAQIRLPRIK